MYIFSTLSHNNLCNKSVQNNITRSFKYFTVTSLQFNSQLRLSTRSPMKRPHTNPLDHDSSSDSDNTEEKASAKLKHKRRKEATIIPLQPPDDTLAQQKTRNKRTLLIRCDNPLSDDPLSANYLTLGSFSENSHHTDPLSSGPDNLILFPPGRKGNVLYLYTPFLKK